MEDVDKREECYPVEEMTIITARAFVYPSFSLMLSSVVPTIAAWVKRFQAREVQRSPDIVYLFGRLGATGSGIWSGQPMLEDVSKGRPLVSLPSMMDSPDTVTYEEGDLAVLFCSVDNLGDHTFKPMDHGIID
ncbi:hypothetical protein Btru_059919 [Bulinus truncatus]|nr:hypothetical protein Btru_059919 [Bulinus truncatus]